MNRHKESLLEAFAKVFHCTLRELDAVIELWLQQRDEGKPQVCAMMTLS